ncbi:MAG: hypothetical protein KDE53_12035 [Caldilineaceae bacterium]|nr:hypothetical protein [Caldilineaceae bacterium]MCB0122150.1 hypothetical protein [Caldilineaceae bacterium]
MHLLDQQTQAYERQRYYGVHPAEVTDINDPHQQGRVRVRLPWAPDANGGGYAVWARLAVLMAGNNRGTWFVPDVGDEVLVAFECGDPRRPYVLGMLWNGQDAPPDTMDGAQNNVIKSIVSRNGIRIEFDDTDGQETLTLKTPQQTIVVNDGERSITITDANGNSVTLDAGGISIQAAAQVEVNAATVNVSAGMVKVDAGMSKFSGVVQCDTLIATTVVGATYTPGAGNIW